MLVITRRKDERIEIGDDVIITIVETHTGRVKIGIDAPKELRISRCEPERTSECSANG